ncbi:hypothetical protein EGW08_006879, partial [Elysia chlorotica]
YLEWPGQVINLDLPASGFHHVTGTKAFYLYARLSRGGGFCSVGLIPEKLFRPSYQLPVIEPMTATSAVFVVVIVKTAEKDAVTVGPPAGVKRSADLCYNVTASDWSGCYFELQESEKSQNDTFVVEMEQATGSVFGAYLFATHRSRNNTACSLLGMAQAPSILDEFDLNEYLSSVQSQHLCEVTTTESATTISNTTAPDMTTENPQENGSTVSEPLNYPNTSQSSNSTLASGETQTHSYPGLDITTPDRGLTSPTDRDSDIATTGVQQSYTSAAYSGGGTAAITTPGDVLVTASQSIIPLTSESPGSYTSTGFDGNKESTSTKSPQSYATTAAPNVNIDTSPTEHLQSYATTAAPNVNIDTSPTEHLQSYATTAAPNVNIDTSPTEHLQSYATTAAPNVNIDTSPTEHLQSYATTAAPNVNIDTSPTEHLQSYTTTAAPSVNIDISSGEHLQSYTTTTAPNVNIDTSPTEHLQSYATTAAPNVNIDTSPTEHLQSYTTTTAPSVNIDTSSSEHLQSYTTTTTTTTTTTAPDGTTGVKPTEAVLCRRAQSPKTNTTLTQKEVQETVEEIVTHLSVQTEKLSSVTRSKTSAPDDRASSTTMGMGGMVFIGVVFGLIILSDISKILHDLRIAMRNIKKSKL